MESPGILAGSFLMMVAVIVTTALFGRFSPFYRRELAVGNREWSLDGLRGLAALMVATHHAALCRSWLTTGNWSDAQSKVLQNFGPAGVLIFFMLAGYLFWGKAHAAKGWMNPWPLWRGRFFRIAPLYLFSLALILLVATIESGGGWFSWANWKPMLRLLTLGALEWHSVGKLNPAEINAYVVWMLRDLWRFYLLLPFIAWLAFDRKIHGITIATFVFVAAGIWFALAVSPGLYFIFGMLACEFLRYQSFREHLRRPLSAIAALSISLVLCCLVGGSTRASLARDVLAVICFPVFITAAAGNTFFGFLTHPAIRCLGAISFSLYLLHAIVFKFLGYALKTANWHHLSLAGFWVVYITTAVATICLCAVTYRWIEFPFLSLNRKMRAERRRPDKLPDTGP